MKLQCTKKLLEWLGVKPARCNEEIDPIFAWTANLLTVNRRKMLVAVHVASRCMFVMYGLTAKDIRKLPELFLDGIRIMMESECIRPEIIDRYLTDCGRTVEFISNTSSSVVASCNKNCERARWFSDCFEPGDLYQRRLLPWINDDVVPKEDYQYTYKLLISQLAAKYGEDVCRCRAVELEVTMNLHTPCKRTLVIPDHLNFYQLHNILQDAFEWQDCHLHQFVLEVDQQGYPAKVIEPQFMMQKPEWTPVPVTRLVSEDTDLRSVFSEQKVLAYEYDFGDGWVHRVECKQVIEDSATVYPYCTEAIGDAPMENCGGPDGFADAMYIMNNTQHPEYRDFCEWLRGCLWSHVDLKEINWRMKLRYRRCLPLDDGE